VRFLTIPSAIDLPTPEFLRLLLRGMGRLAISVMMAWNASGGICINGWDLFLLYHSSYKISKPVIPQLKNINQWWDAVRAEVSTEGKCSLDFFIVFVFF
jgi:hypothetical protein